MVLTLGSTFHLSKSSFRWTRARLYKPAFSRKKQEEEVFDDNTEELKASFVSRGKKKKQFHLIFRGHDKALTREEQEASIQAFLMEEVIRLREARKGSKEVRRAYHEEGFAGSERSKKFLEQEKKKEASFIFSRTERNKVG